ncbi:MAG TPA: hypothetical protein VD907_03195 [Verrucomicrobiae bacterium]|nr:hypothetical protein [Verrucomicrobiae bacterium]
MLHSILQRFLPHIFFSALALVILLPLLSPGFIFALDMVFGPHIELPSDVRSSYLFYGALHILNMAIPADALQKILLLAIFLLAGIGAFRLAQTFALQNQPSWSFYIAGVLYAVNPFVYSRFMVGQFSVLLGYALLPLSLVLLWKFLQRPNLKNGGILVLTLLVLSIVSIHMAGIFILPATVLFALNLYRIRQSLPKVRTLLIRTSVVIISVLIGSLYWLIPAVAGSGHVAIITSFTPNDLLAFATYGGGLGIIGNILTLQGFWAEGMNLYLKTQDLYSWWWLPLVGLWVVAILGFHALFKAQKDAAVSLLILLVLTVGLAAGAASFFTLGYREPQKFAAVVAIVLSLLTGYGSYAIVRLVNNLHAQAFGSLLCLPLLFVLPLATAPLVFGGLHGQFQPRDYPQDWHMIRERLHKEPSAKVVFLPWHMYMEFSFAGKVIMNPAPAFFRNPVIISNDPEFRGAHAGHTTNDQRRIESLLHNPKREDFTKELNLLSVKYVLLAKEFDYKKYAFIDDLGLIKIADTENLILYKVTPEEAY